MISLPSLLGTRLSTLLLASLICLASALCSAISAKAESDTPIPPSLITPDRVETSIGTLEFKDGAPSAETAEKVYDTLDFTRAPGRVQQQLPRRVGVRDPSRAFSASAPRTTRSSSSPS